VEPLEHRLLLASDLYPGVVAGGPGVGTGTLAQINVFLQGWGANNAPAPILPATQTWVVIHGRVDSSVSFRGMAASLAQATGDQVLLLDRSQGAADNSLFGLEGAGWITRVAQWAATSLRTVFEVEDTLARLVGHSWGSYVAYEIAERQAGEVQTIVALDPAQNAATQYPAGNVNFAASSVVAWSFFGDGLYGDAARAGTADAAFGIAYSGNPGIGERHSAPRRLFQRLLDDSAQHRIGQMLSAERLEAGYGGGGWPWTPNGYATYFEGWFTLADANTDGEYGEAWSDVTQLKYKIGSAEVLVSGNAPRFVAGDTNGDGSVDAFDLNMLATHWQQPLNATWTEGDFNADGKVDAFDLNLLATNWQTGAALPLVDVSPLTSDPAQASVAGARKVPGRPPQRSRSPSPMPLPPLAFTGSWKPTELDLLLRASGACGDAQ
jgi:pimeloyl-ACP methyl ester carboxylesterase